jgi:hypothetical protein
MTDENEMTTTFKASPAQLCTLVQDAFDKIGRRNDARKP